MDTLPRFLILSGGWKVRRKETTHPQLMNVNESIEGGRIAPMT